jgi:putative intracellular protease/amidase
MNAPITLAAAIAGGLDAYAGVFVPGGQAPGVDLMQDADLGEILRHFHEASKPTALLCHGPIAVVAALPHAREFRSALIAGDPARAAEWARGWQYAGYRMTVFSNSEEKVVEDHVLKAKLYFTVADALTTAGGVVSTSSVDFEPNVVEDRELITGQNPHSDKPLAERLVAALDRAAERLHDRTCQDRRRPDRPSGQGRRARGPAEFHARPVAGGAGQSALRSLA